MIIELDLNSELPIYQQLRNQIVVGMAVGRLLPGDPLPSVRQLGVDLGINLHTVNKAYSLLKQEGFLTIHRQKGVVISDAASHRSDAVHLAHLESELATLLAEARVRGLGLEQTKEMADAIWSRFNKA